MDLDFQASSLSFVTSCLGQSPLILVWLAGLFLVVTRWERYPRVSLFLLIAILIEFVALMSSLFFAMGLIPWFYQQGWGAGQIGTAVAASGIFHSILSAVAWGLVIFAAFGWRDNPMPQTARNDSEEG
ncbi:MAG: hypothetical protein L6R45_10960 [Anaerolineae bacterium]|nr:hypothetical protein [Anaerolineae bacterium]